MPGNIFATERSVAGLRARVASWRGRGETIALVPTMGALHEGHGALMTAAKKAADRVIVSLFVNPTQFGPGEDYTAYPRDEAADRIFLETAGVDLLYAPDAAEMYPRGFETSISVSGLGDVLCGVHRPGHFDGVVTVVAKLLSQATPDNAFFGEKDYQQLCVIRRVVRDLDLPVDIRGVATVREADGLAISSRNAYLRSDERAVAPALYGTLTEVADRIAGGGGIDQALAGGVKALGEAGFGEVDYLVCADAETLTPVTALGRPARVFAAAHLGRARLIDNVAVPD
ncbi:MAG: pantoate--beta-alanine ligase [Alphaproteobacteria bacterium]|nr:pantoate--beta-alanine ligase [Alphaproteobacteria bacterium]